MHKFFLIILMNCLLVAHVFAVDYRQPDKMPFLFKSNKPTKERIALGKKLFFDQRLSGNNRMSCASCHQPNKYWTDGLPKAKGLNGKVLARATPTIINTGYNQKQFWDGRASSLEQQSIMPITSPDEMNQDMNELIKELKQDPDYVKAFNKAFNIGGISKVNISRAIAAFQRSIVSNKSPFDRWLSGDHKALSDNARKGFKLFNTKAECFLCHHGFNFQDDGFHNIGLKTDGKDLGRYKVKKVPVLKGAFKTPTLRNVARTAPYMHNGIYKNLREVIEHYNRGGDVKENLDPNIRPLGLSDAEINQLLAFLDSLTEDKALLQADSSQRRIQ